MAETEVVRAGKRIVQLESRVWCGPVDSVGSSEPDETATLVATATGSFAVLGAAPDTPA